ncbi:MAG TPA: hypothetical protein VGR20_08025 [Acidimicrobiia bacterium]|nr:hypothetical protein [Acidimicrobiia bacterium]
MSEPNAENLRDKLDEGGDEILDYVEKNSPRPSVDTDVAERLLTEAPPAEAAAELDKMIEGFQSGAGAATGRRTEPAATDPPTDAFPTDAFPTDGADL